MNIFPTVLANFQESVDYDNVLVTARSCARLAFHKNYRYFGLANNGECRVGPDMKSHFFKSKTSAGCSSSVGKTDAIYVYTLGKRVVVLVSAVDENVRILTRTDRQVNNEKNYLFSQSSNCWMTTTCLTR